jgi:hypothetical protein
MTEQIKDIRVIEYIDFEDDIKSMWRLQIDYGDGWQNVKVRSTTCFGTFKELEKGIQ